MEIYGIQGTNQKRHIVQQSSCHIYIISPDLCISQVFSVSPYCIRCHFKLFKAVGPE